MDQEPEQTSSGVLQHEAEHTRSNKRNSALTYLVILFAAAFLLLLLSYFMQQRTNQEKYNNLQQTSKSAVQSLDNVLEENADLKAENTELEQQITALQDQLKRAQQDTKNEKSQLETLQGEQAALSTLNHIRALYNQGRYRDARAYLTQQESAAPGATEHYLASYTAKQSTEELGVYHPLKAYRQLVEWLNQ